jgi:hypothetical protein
VRANTRVGAELGYDICVTRVTKLPSTVGQTSNPR